MTNDDLKELLKSQSTRKARSRDREGSVSRANRGMDFESDINITNAWYNENKKCAIIKRPTPIKVIKTDYQKRKITEAVFEKQSTADYNGVYKGRYIDFEAKSTMLKNALPLDKIKLHQIKHLRNVMNHGGIAFYLINFVEKDEVYLLDCLVLFNHIENDQPKSISYDFIKKMGHLVPIKFAPRIDYLSVVGKVYF